MSSKQARQAHKMAVVNIILSIGIIIYLIFKL